MRLIQEDNLKELTENEINGLFDRFSFPMLRPCITQRQRNTSIEIANFFWIRLVTGTDTEVNIYEDLRDLVKLDHDGNRGIGSMYFFKMKTELTADEIARLKKHYSNSDNFQRLKNWEPSPPGKPSKGRTTP